VIETEIIEDGILSRSAAQVEARHRGLDLIPERPAGSGRGWLLQQKKKNPNAVTIFDLQEIIKKEKFHKRYEHLRHKKRVQG